MSPLIEQATQKFKEKRLDESELMFKDIIHSHLSRDSDSVRALVEKEERSDGDSCDGDSEIIALAYLRLGLVLQAQGKFDEAIAVYENALEVKPGWADACNNLGNAFYLQGQYDAALLSYQRALDHNPQVAEAHNNIANVLLQKSKLAEAEQSCRAALGIKENYPDAHHTLGSILQAQGHLTDAVQSYRQAIKLDSYPNARVHYNLGNSLHAQGDGAGAQAAYQEALTIMPNFAEARMAYCFSCLPIIYPSAEDVDRTRDLYAKRLAELDAYCQSLSDDEHALMVEGVGAFQPYFLAYQGQNDRELQEAYGRIMIRIMASRYPQWSQSVPLSGLRTDEKVRIGIVSGYFREHSVWKIPLKGWVENLDRAEFELFGYYTDSIQDRETVVASKSFKKFIQGPLSVERWGQIISEDKPHILIFSEFGMDPMTFQLGCLRLAPIQMTAPGHPETSGLETIDYFLSSDLMESETADQHYTEALVRLPNLGHFYTPLSYSPEAASREEIGVGDDEVMFWCCQSLFKYLPQHDDVFPAIASRLPNARFVFIEFMTGSITQVFQDRLQRAFAQFELDYQDFCRFVPRMSSRKFAGMAALADVFLDSIGWSGHNSALESVVFELPIVTFPGPMMRGRHALAILKRLGIDETIASSKQGYVDLAVRLGQDIDYRNTLSNQVAQNKHRLYGDRQSVQALEDILLGLVNKPRRSHHTGSDVDLDRANTLQSLGQLVEARDLYQRILANQPNHPQALSGMASVALKNGEYQVAEQLFTQAVTVQPDCFSAWFSLGNIFQGQERLDEAIAAYRTVIELRSDLLPVYNNLAYALQQKGQLNDAIHCYRQALALQPDSQTIDVHLANAMYLNGELPQEQWQHYAILNHKLGLTSKAKNDRGGAIAYFQQATTLNPTLAEAHLELGILRRDAQGKPEEALACFETVKSLEAHWQEPSTEVNLYTEMGRTYQILQRLDEAVQAFQTVVRLVNPHYDQYCREHPVQAVPPSLDAFIPTEIVFETVDIGGHLFPAIPTVPASEQDRPFWSVAIPAVNRPEYFPECLASVLAQWTGEADMEIVVLDNGSNPPLFEIVNALGRGIIRYYRFPKTIPLQSNWNNMVSLCRGQWIHLLQHDDYVLHGFYNRLKNSLEHCPDTVGAAFTGYENIDEHRQVVFTQEHNLKHFRGIVKDWVKRIGVSCPLSPPSLVVRRAAYEHLGGYKQDLLYTCDWELYKRIASFYDWWYEPGILAHYRQHDNSLTVTLNQEDGSSGAAHRRAIAISESYLPEAVKQEITAQSRRFHNYWCLERANIPLKAGYLEGAFCLVQEALRIDHSPEGIDQVFNWLASPQGRVLRSYITSRLMEENQRQSSDVTNFKT